MGSSLPVGDYHLVQLIVRANLVIGPDGEVVSFYRFGNGHKIHPDIVGGEEDGSGGGTGNEQFISGFHRLGFYQKLGHAEITEVLDGFAHIHLSLGGSRSIAVCPLSQPLSKIVTIPESPVEYGGETLVPVVYLDRKSVV